MTSQSSAKTIQLSDHRETLLAYEQRYRSTKGDERQEVVKAIVEEIAPQGKGKLRHDATAGLESKIQNWYNNNKTVLLEGGPTIVPVGTHWNYRLVIQNLFKDEIAKKMDKTGLKSSDSDWLQNYQWAVNEVIESEGGETVAPEKYGKIAKSWNEVGPPEEFKTKVAMKKSGPTIDTFLKKMQQQMGVAIVGFATYRDDEGKLCTFDFCTKDDRKATFTQANSKDVEGFLGKWGKWVAEKGVGSIQPNEREDEDEEEPEEMETDGWMRLLDSDDGVLSLKPWMEVTDSKANKANIALALRAVMRQAWERWGRRGNIPWSEIKADQKSLIASRFLLKAKLANPTRMSLQDITAYWNHWVSKDQKGDPFSFGFDGDDDNNSDGGVGQGAAEKPPSVSSNHSIEDIPFPYLCNTPYTRTNCLQKLVLNKGETGQRFHTLVRVVDALEDTDTPSIYQNSRWPFIHWSWSTTHLPADIHQERELADTFLHWLALKASSLANQLHPNKSQLQELLLGVALALRDLELACFTEPGETITPAYLAQSCMQATDLDSIGDIVETILRTVQDQVEEESVRISRKEQTRKKGPKSPKKVISKRKRSPSTEPSEPEDSELKGQSTSQPRRSRRTKKQTTKKAQEEKNTQQKQSLKKTRQKPAKAAKK